MPEVMTKPEQKCRRCNGVLVRDEKRDCLFCPICYPPNTAEPAPPQKKVKYVDVAMTEGRVREIVRDELENWHIQKPPVTKTETKELTERHKPVVPLTMEGLQTLESEPPNWREQAKELGILLFHRTKADVLKEIEARTSGLNNVPTDGGQ